jgi:hypothetical protein
VRLAANDHLFSLTQAMPARKRQTKIGSFFSPATPPSQQQQSPKPSASTTSFFGQPNPETARLIRETEKRRKVQKGDSDDDRFEFGEAPSTWLHLCCLVERERREMSFNLAYCLLVLHPRAVERLTPPPPSPVHSLADSSSSSGSGHPRKNKKKQPKKKLVSRSQLPRSTCPELSAADKDDTEEEEEDPLLLTRASLPQRSQARTQWEGGKRRVGKEEKISLALGRLEDDDRESENDGNASEDGEGFVVTDEEEVDEKEVGESRRKGKGRAHLAPPSSLGKRGRIVLDDEDEDEESEDTQQQPGPSTHRLSTPRSSSRPTASSSKRTQSTINPSAAISTSTSRTKRKAVSLSPSVGPSSASSSLGFSPPPTAFRSPPKSKKKRIAAMVESDEDENESDAEEKVTPRKGRVGRVLRGRKDPDDSGDGGAEEEDLRDDEGRLRTFFPLSFLNYRSRGLKTACSS